MADLVCSSPKCSHWLIVEPNRKKAVVYDYLVRGSDIYSDFVVWFGLEPYQLKAFPNHLDVRCKKEKKTDNFLASFLGKL